MEIKFRDRVYQVHRKGNLNYLRLSLLLLPESYQRETPFAEASAKERLDVVKNLVEILSDDTQVRRVCYALESFGFNPQPDFFNYEMTEINGNVRINFWLNLDIAELMDLIIAIDTGYKSEKPQIETAVTPVEPASAKDRDLSSPSQSPFNPIQRQWQVINK